ncbi:MAG: malonyl-CoA synthase [Gammaproteobacteria bacterium]|nr:malonyl-CoA synthase [Gammaproteobacteria bacterium]
MNKNIFNVFESRFPENREACFIETPNGTTYSYAHLEKETARLARFLTDAGVVKGDRVAVQVEKSAEVIFLYLACLRAGFVYLPLNTAYTESELNYFIENAEPAVVVCKAQAQTFFENAKSDSLLHVFTLANDGETGTLVENSRSTDAEFETVSCDTDDLAVILYTSGTTGRPKGAMITHGNLASNGLALQEAWEWKQEDVLLHALPIFHIHGLFIACHNVLLGGSKMLFVEKFDSKTMIELLPKATVMMGVPTFYTRLLDDADFNADVCRNMRLFISGSAPLLEQTFNDFKKRSGHTILERYGMTETGMNTSNPVNGERLAGTVGLPLPGVAARIVDADNNILTEGVGALQVKGPNVFKGYWKLPEKTAEEFTADGYFKTGDMAEISDSCYISIVGRDKDMIITGGYNVYPKEIELVLDEVTGVKESAVFGLPHKDFGEAVTAVIVVENGQTAPSEADIIKQLKLELASYKVPKKIIVVDALVRNTMGKVQKNVLRETYSELYNQ